VVLGNPEGAGTQDGTAIFGAGTLPAAQGGFPAAQDVYSVGSQGELAQTGANSMLPVAMVAGFGLLLAGITFIFLNSRRHRQLN
jgi:LPXTG-motif cell wall-anchored protein